MKRKIWICTECFDVYELRAQDEPPRNAHGDVLCLRCRPPLAEDLTEESG